MPRPPAPEVKQVRKGGPPAALIGGVVLLVVVLIGVLVWAATRGGDLGATGSSSTLPDGGGVSVGPGVDADVTQVRVYEDFQCPWCGRLENSIGDLLSGKAEAGEINLTYQVMSFLDGSLGNDSSTRAANAALCADDAGGFVPFHASVYANMGQEGQGYTDEQFTQWAQDAGLAGGELETFQQCVADSTHADYVDAMQERANRDGVTGTPTMFVNGTKLGNEEMSLLMQDPSALDGILEAHSR
jgi:protein-disulfide isomerase